LNREGTLAISPPQANLGTFASLFLVTLSTLTYETLLTRIFSVTMWYHFAFVAISVALFGMTVGALIVYLAPSRFPVERTNERLVQSSLLFGLSIVLSFLTQLALPFVGKWSIEGVYSVVTLYLVIAVPFVFSGVFVCLALTRFPRQISRLYAADLVGAAVGAVALVWLLEVMDAPSAVVVVAALPAVGSLWLALAGHHERMFWLGLLAALFFLNFALINRHHPLLRLTWVAGSGTAPRYEESAPVYERWNAFSRIRIDRHSGSAPVGWGLSPTVPKDLSVQQLDLVIDSAAYTVLTGYSGDPRQIQYLKYDVTNLAHNVRKAADVLVVGVGGGRDVLSALAFNQRSVTGVEMNDAILHAVNGVYGDFTGHLDRDPRVTFVNDEARSYIARSKKQYDIIQLSLTDTWAATSAGAYALSENSLYTVQAWDTFLDHLKPGGLLSVSRFYELDRPMEAYRLVSLATKTLRERGVTNPRDHIYMAAMLPVTTILVSPSPLSDADVAALDETAKDMEFRRVLTPNYVDDKTFAEIVEADDLDAYVSHFSLNIAAPTDDKPFFFEMIRLEDLLRGNLPHYKHLTEPVIVLAELTIAVLVMTLLCIILPLLLTRKKANLRSMMPFFVFFAAIGLGFLLIEVSQMQRLIIFLGHPTYGLSVVLFSLLLFSGIGSFATERIARPGLQVSNLLPFVLLLSVLIASGFVTPLVAHHWDSQTTPMRILVATAILAPMGLAMGMPFPIGMKAVSAWPDAPTPYFWGINGATSVCASVLAVAIALSNGISAAFWTGCICYAVAVAGLSWGILRARS
jgi:hypothetical protein